MLEKLTGAFSDIIRTVSGKASITEKNIEESVEKIKMALLEADVNLRVVRRFVNSTVEEAKGEKVLRAVDPGQPYAAPGWEAEVNFSVVLEADRIVLHAHCAGTAAQQLIVQDNGAPVGLELYLFWMASTTGASGFISDIDIAGG